MSDKGGYCYSCQKWKPTSKLTTCRMCESPTLYCISEKCSQDPCETCGREQPGNWKCDSYGHEHILKRGQETHKCVVCDEFDYCLKHLIQCSCGEGETHYLCKDYSCDEKTRCKGKNCNKRLCPNGELIKGISETVFCDEHIPKHKFKRRLIEAVKEEEK